MNGRFALKTVLRHAQRKLADGDTSQNWQEIQQVVSNCLTDEAVCPYVELALEADARRNNIRLFQNRDFLVAGCVDDDECECDLTNMADQWAAYGAAIVGTDGAMAVGLSPGGTFGDLGDGQILAQIIEFLKWLLQPEHIDALVKLISAIVAIFVGL